MASAVAVALTGTATLSAWSQTGESVAEHRTDTAPQRVVSMNLCTDQFAMLLAAPDQLVSVTHVARDPRSSPMADIAEGFSTNHGGAEEIFLMAPDLVLAGEWSDPIAVAMLRGLGVRVETVASVSSLAEVTMRLRDMGALLGREAVADQQIAQFNADLAALSPSTDARPRAAFYFPNGYTLGTGTLSDEILGFAGFTNVAVELGRSFGGMLPLEELVLAAPDMIIRSELYPGASRSEEILLHPALTRLSGTARGMLSTADWVCGTPFILNALSDLAAAHDRVTTQSPHLTEGGE